MEKDKRDLLERIEKLENTVGKVDKLGMITFRLLFILMAKSTDYGSVRGLKDMVVGMLKSEGLSTETVEEIHDYMLAVCEKSDSDKERSRLNWGQGV